MIPDARELTEVRTGPWEQDILFRGCGEMAVWGWSGHVSLIKTQILMFSQSAKVTELPWV